MVLRFGKVSKWDGRVKRCGGGMVVGFGTLSKGLKMFFGNSFGSTLDLGKMLDFGRIGGWGIVL